MFTGWKHRAKTVLIGLAFSLQVCDATGAQQSAVEFFDTHFHLTNYIQEGTDIRRFLEIMSTNVGRSTLFGIPLQQEWSHRSTGDRAPTYYLHSDAPLYYYSFTDAHIAT